MDEIHFFCVICGETLCAAPENAGGFCGCPRCMRVIPVPGFPARPAGAPEAAEAYSADILGIELKFFCVHCANKVQVDARRRGQTIECPVCHEPTTVPDWRGAVLPLRDDERPVPPSGLRLSSEEHAFLCMPLPPRASTPATAVLS